MILKKSSTGMQKDELMLSVRNYLIFKINSANYNSEF